MNSPWECAQIGKLCSKIGSGITPRGGDSVYVQNGVSLIRSQNVHNKTFSEDGLAHITAEQAEKMKGVEVFPDDVLLNITGDSVARCCIVPEHVLPARVNQHVAIIRTFSEKLDPEFLMYFLVSPFMQSTMLSLAGSGGTRKALTKDLIERFIVPLPKIEVQRNISSFLSAYDNLLVNNNKRIKLLGQAIGLIYKEWFLCLRFPGHEHKRIIGGVPDGWEKGPLGKIATVKSGFAFKSKDWLTEGNPVIKIKNITGSGDVDVNDCECISDAVANAASRFRLVSGDILIAMTGATIGKVGIMPSTDRTYYLNQRVGVFDPKKHSSNTEFLWAVVNTDLFQTQVKNLSAGAAQPNISAAQIESIEVIIPEERYLLLFSEYTQAMLKEILILRSQINYLELARDLIIPKLMNGEIAV